MRSEKDRAGVVLIVVVLIIFAVIVAFKVVLDSKPKAGEDFCVGTIEASTVILLDHSEAVSEQTREEIVARALVYITKNAKINERISVFTISDLSRKSLKPVVSLCRPPQTGNRAVENVRNIERDFKEKFEAPIRNALSQEFGGSNESPIAQAITDISLSQYLRGKGNSLLVFSDMIEHNPRFSMYKCDNVSPVVDKYRLSRQGAQERPAFVNTRVSLHLIPRISEAKSTLLCRDKFWPWFFGNNTGPEASLTWDYLPGGSPSK